MSPVIRANWFLLTLAVLMGLTLYAHYRQQPDSYLPITDLDSSHVQRLEIHHQGKTTLLQRKDGNWVDARSGSPVEDPSLPANLLHIARLPSLYHFSANAHKLQEFGLKPPRFRLKLDELTILVGDPDPASGLRYVQVGDQIHLVSDSYTRYLMQQP